MDCFGVKPPRNDETIEYQHDFCVRHTTNIRDTNTSEILTHQRYTTMMLKLQLLTQLP